MHDSPHAYCHSNPSLNRGHVQVDLYLFSYLLQPEVLASQSLFSLHTLFCLVVSLDLHTSIGIDWTIVSLLNWTSTTVHAKMIAIIVQGRQYVNICKKHASSSRQYWHTCIVQNMKKCKAVVITVRLSLNLCLRNSSNALKHMWTCSSAPTKVRVRAVVKFSARPWTLIQSQSGWVCTRTTFNYTRLRQIDL